MKNYNLNFDKDGLIPVVVQDYLTNEVLTLAYMNEESLAVSLEEGKTCFYSRKRKCLWRKGETSGNTQEIISITSDCDSDALVIKVRKKGPACHLNTESCFTNNLYSNGEKVPFSVSALYEFIKERKTSPQEGSYTTYLFEKGLDKILKKVGEESTEVIIGATKKDKPETLYELADLTYHAMVLMIEMGFTLQDLHEELAKRHVIDHKVKQEKMQ